MLRPRDGGYGSDSHPAPAVGALVTDEVERVSWKNGLLFHELLSAFSAADNVVPFRSGSHTLQLHEFRVQFVKASEMAPRPRTLAEAQLAEAVALREGTFEAQSAWLSFEEREGGAVVHVREREDISDALAAHEGRMPWYERFRASLRQSLQYMEPELLGCPAAMLLVVSSSDTNPIERFKELSLAYHWPASFQTGQFGTHDIPKVYVLLHDETEGIAQGTNGLIHAAEILRQMKAEFPTSPSKLLRINSLPPQSANLQQADIWRLPLQQQHPPAEPFFPFDSNCARVRHPVVGGGGEGGQSVRGACLSSEDLLNLRDFVLELTWKIVIPALERRVFTLQASVTQSRKGVKNFVKSFWRKPRDSEQPPQQQQHQQQQQQQQQQPDGGIFLRSNSPSAVSLRPVLYRYDRIESQIRLLADTLFMMQDWEGALSNYKLVRDDYRSDKAWLHLGSVYEQIALCYSHLNTGGLEDGGGGAGGEGGREGRYKRDVEVAIEEAVKAYFRRAEEEEQQQLGVGTASGVPYAAGRINGEVNSSSSGSSSHSGCGARMATRASLRGAEVFLTASPPKAVDAAILLVSAAKKETPLCAAVLVEQAAWAYLQGGNIRKFAFFMSMAGQTFLSCSSEKEQQQQQKKQHQERHAVRCYASALALYEGSWWEHALDHIHLNLGRQLLLLGHPERALYHLLRLLVTSDHAASGGGRERGGGSGLSAKVQATLLQDLLQTCRDRPAALAAVVPYLDAGSKTFVAVLCRGMQPQQQQQGDQVVVPNLRLPWVVEETLSISQGTEEPQGGEVEEMKGELQRELKTAAVMGEKGGSMRRWVSALGKVAKEEARSAALLSKRHGGSGSGMRWGGRDEPITVSVEVQNPLQISVTLTDMQVSASFDDTQASSSSSPSFSATGAGAGAAIPLETETIEVHLAPLERKRLSLQIRPRRCGTLRVTGLRWRLFGQLWGSISFSAPGPLLQDTLEHRASRARGMDVKFVTRVVPELPLLEVEWEGLPEALFQGEVVKTFLRITNRGLAAAASVYAKSNLPSWLFMRDPAEVEKEQGVWGGVCMSMVGMSGTVFRVATGGLPGAAAGGGCTVRVPVWVRGLGGGKQTLRVLVRYERQHATGGGGTAVGTESQEYRYTEVAQDVCVLPSVSVVPSVSPSYSQPGECILSLNVSNYRTDGSASDREVELHSVVALSRLWRLEPIGGILMGGGGAATMGWQERTTLHYRLIPLEREEDLVVYEHELQSGALRVSSSTFSLSSSLTSSNSSSTSTTANSMVIDDGFLPTPFMTSLPSSSSSSWASLDFLYVENASQSYRTARDEAKRRETTSAAASTASNGKGGRQECGPLSLGEIKRKKAEEKAREVAAIESAAAAAAAAATVGAGSDHHISPTSSSSSPEHRPMSPKLGMGMEGSGRKGHLAAVVPRGRATLTLIVIWRLTTTSHLKQAQAHQQQEGEQQQRPQTRICLGQHQVLNHAVRPLTLDPTSAAPLTITVDAPSLVMGRLAHSLAEGAAGRREGRKGGLLQNCYADVLVTVHNRMTDMSVDFVFEALSAPSGKRQSANKAAASPSFLWVGSTSREIKALLPGTSVRLPIRAMFLRPGVYDLNRFRFVVLMAANASQLVPGALNSSKLKILHGNTVRVPYIFSAQYLIKVEASSVAAAGAVGAGAAGTASDVKGGGRAGRISSALGLSGEKNEEVKEKEGGKAGGWVDDDLSERLVVLVEQARAKGGSGGEREGRAEEAESMLLSPAPLVGGEEEREETMEDVDTRLTPLDRSLVGTREEEEAEEGGGRGESGASFSPPLSMVTSSAPPRSYASPMPVAAAAAATERAIDGEREGKGEGGDGEVEVEVAEDQTFSTEGQEQARQQLELGEVEGEGEDGMGREGGAEEDGGGEDGSRML